jgi:hypothetical protein
MRRVRSGNTVDAQGGSRGLECTWPQGWEPSALAYVLADWHGGESCGVLEFFPSLNQTFCEYLIKPFMLSQSAADECLQLREIIGVDEKVGALHKGL